jgi:hypothetical protein
VTVARVYFTCFPCGLGEYAADARLGIEGSLTAEARRLACLAGVQRSFEHGTTLLQEFCGWTISHESVRQTCYSEAMAVEEWRAESTVAWPAATPNRTAEFQTDATKINTTTGWRDMKIALFCQRKNALPCEAAGWLQRDLPAPDVRFAFVAVEEIETFQEKWLPWATRLGMKSFEGLHVVADGADWIWNAAGDCFPGHGGVLDIFHASEHIADTSKVLHGEGSDACRSWHESTRMALLRSGWLGVQAEIGRVLAGVLTDEQRRSVEELTAYLANRQTRLDYASCLGRGRSIGSGQIEGACKNAIGKRMKQTGARWTVSNANRMAVLTCLSYSDQWHNYWTAA